MDLTPVKSALSGEYLIELSSLTFFRDGGTIGFAIKTPDGNTFQLSRDKRINSITKGAFYLGNHPGRDDSNDRYIGNDERLNSALEEALSKSV